MKRVKLVTFGDGNYGFRAAGRRLASQAGQSGLFSRGVENYDLARLYREAPNFKVTSGQFINQNVKGLGNYVWKPQLLLQSLLNSQDGDIVCLIDAGCQLNITDASRKRFDSYLDSATSTGGLFMQIQAGSFGDEKFLDCEWSKKLLLEQLDPDQIYRYTPQIQSGIILMAKNDMTIDFATNWLELSERDNHSLLRSPVSADLEDPCFRGHRWEQSILSLLVKGSNFSYIPDETYWHPNWRNGANFPIWAMRNRSGGDSYRRNSIDLIKIALSRLIH